MRTPLDAMLSVRRWVLGVLPAPPWTVLLAGDQGRVERPYAVVASADGATGSQEGQETVRMVLPMVVHAFPPSVSRASNSKVIAERVAAALDAAIRAGMPDYLDPTVRGRQQRIPLWDYGGGASLSLEELSAVDLSAASVSRLRPDFLTVSDGWKTQAMPQADTGDLFVATLEMRVQWFAPTGVPVGGPLLTAVNPDVRGE